MRRRLLLLGLVAAGLCSDAASSRAEAQVTGKEYDVTVTINFKYKFRSHFAFDATSLFNATDPYKVDPLTMLPLNTGMGFFVEADQGMYSTWVVDILTTTAATDVAGVQIGPYLLGLGLTEELVFFTVFGTESTP